MGSSSPMINRNSGVGTTGGGAAGEMTQRYDSAGSPLLPPPSIGGGGGGAFLSGATFGAGVAGSHGHGSTHDGASTYSDSGGPFSGADAAIMAQAFRKTLRQPDFAGRPVEEGESPEQPEGSGEGALGAGAGGTTATGASPLVQVHRRGTASSAPEETGSAVMSQELAEEGRDIRSVSSSRGVTVESVQSPEPREPDR